MRAFTQTGEKNPTNLNLCFDLSVKEVQDDIHIYLYFFFKSNIQWGKKTPQISCYAKPENLFHNKTPDCIKNYS